MLKTCFKRFSKSNIFTKFFLFEKVNFIKPTIKNHSYCYQVSVRPDYEQLILFGNIVRLCSKPKTYLKISKTREVLTYWNENKTLVSLMDLIGHTLLTDEIIYCALRLHRMEMKDFPERKVVWHCPEWKVDWYCPEWKIWTFHSGKWDCPEWKIWTFPTWLLGWSMCK